MEGIQKCVSAVGILNADLADPLLANIMKSLEQKADRAVEKVLRVALRGATGDDVRHLLHVSLVANEDYYSEGYCCGNACRHCPMERL